MIQWLTKKIFGTEYDRALRRLKPKIAAINDLGPEMKGLSDAQLQAKTAELREKLGNGQPIDELLVPAFAVCREASARTLEMRHHDIQLVGGMLLHEGKIAEMRAGEGKSLVAALPAYLDALAKKGVHVVTVNDYLVKRDAELMGKLWGFLGLSTGTVVSHQSDDERRKAYRCDITYGQYDEIAFDYLRDRVEASELSFAIVDEVDTILLDKACTPLVLGKGKTIALQSFFRRYKKLSGMTGTAEAEAAELHRTYELECVSIPAERPVIRIDHQDLIYKTKREKLTKIVAEVREKHRAGRPILIGAHSVEGSGVISTLLSEEGIEHQLLGGEDHEKDAYMMAQAGRKGAITVITPMAGRGIDIILGDDPEGDEVRKLGGLYVIGTERHASRRLDAQLRDRAGCQGDPGDSRFYASCEDDLMRIFAGDRIKVLMDRMGMRDDEPIEHPWVKKSLENAQKKVTELNVNARKKLLEGDQT